MAPDRWEHGSNFALPDCDVPVEDVSGFAIRTGAAGAVMVGSGRIALANLALHGARQRGWRRLWVPSYFCEDALTSLATVPIEVLRYVAGPWGQDEPPCGEAGDVLLRVNYFGWGIAPLTEPFAGEVIEDHTHDPGTGFASTADFVVASLRKALPLADGGLYWSPAGHALPPAPPASAGHGQAVLTRLAAMALRRAWLQGAGSADDKERFRTLEIDSEASYLQGHPAPMSVWSQAMLERLSIARLEAARCRNARVLRTCLADRDDVQFDGPEHCRAPVMAVLRLSSAGLRDALRRGLIERRIYPAVLWPQSQATATEPALNYSSTVLMLHVDARYDDDDMQRVAAAVRDILDSARAGR